MNEEYIVVLVTAKDKEEAQTIADALVEEKLVACVNIVDGVNSVFWWENKIDHCPEALMVIKSKKSLFKDIVERVKALHTYTVPEVIALPIIDGNEDYLKWITESVK